MFCFPLFISVQPEIEEWSSWDEDAPTSIKIEGGNGNVSPAANDSDEEPDYFKDMTPTIRKTQKVLWQYVHLLPFEVIFPYWNWSLATNASPLMRVLRRARLGITDCAHKSFRKHQQAHCRLILRVFNADCGEEERASELPGSWWLSGFLQQTGSLSGHDDLQSALSKIWHSQHRQLHA